MYLFTILPFVLGYITFDTKFSGGFNPVDSTCNNGVTLTKKINFVDTFQNTPQIIIVNSRYYTSMNLPMEFNLTLSDITTTSFYANLKCTGKSVYNYLFKWVAIDDSRIEVITKYIDSPPAAGSSETYNFALKNPNLTKRFTSIIGFGLNGDIDFLLSVESVTYNEVSIKLTVNAPTKSVGFQVVLGTDEALKVSSIKSQKITSSSPYDSDVLTVTKYYELILPFCGWSFVTGQSINLGFSQQNNTATTGTITYSYSTTGSYKVELLSFVEAWVNSQNTRVIQPFLCQKVRVSRKYENNLSSAQAISLQIDGFTQTFDSTSGTQKLLIQPTLSFKLLFIYRCQSNRKIYIRILKTTVPSYQIIQRNCYGSINRMSVSVTLSRPDNLNQYMTIEGSSSGIVISMDVYNQEVVKYSIVDTSISLI